VKKEDEIVYDEVKTRDKPAEQTGDTNVTLSYKNELSELKENQTSLLADKNNLTKLNHKLSSDNQNLTREHNNLTDQFKTLTQTYAVLESNVTNLTSQNQKLETQNQHLGTQKQEVETQKQQLETQKQQLETQNQQLETQNQQLTGEKKNLTSRIQDMETQWNEQNNSRALWSVNLYCPITNGERKCKPCLKGWRSPKPPNCYAVNNPQPDHQRTWDSAQEDCKEKNSDLAVIANEEEKTSVDEEVWYDGELWIGLRAENEKWKWLNGSELTDK
ncbi:hypothetical protein GBF38_013806, partial [Nibea albiflora]